MVNAKVFLALNDILNGYSVGEISSGPIYFKHKCIRDNLTSEIIYHRELQKHIQKGVPSEQEQLESIIASELWSRDNENRISFLKELISRDKETRDKFEDRNDVKEISKRIEKSEDELESLTMTRSHLLGRTAENCARVKSNEFIIFSTCYSDTTFKTSYYHDNFEELSDSQIGEIVEEFNKVFDKFDNAIIKEVAFYHEFWERAINSKSVADLYGKPTVEVTSFQIYIYNLAKRYHNIISSFENIPHDALESASALEEWFFATKKGKAKLKESENKSNSDTIAKQQGASSMKDLIRNSGGVGGTKDFLKMMGQNK